jgi:hypothetical protein
VFDEGYGASVPLLRFLNWANQKFVAEVPVNFAVRDTTDGPSRRADARLTAVDARGVRRYRLAHPRVPDWVWRAMGVGVWVAGPEHTLVAAVSEATAEVKYFLTNAWDVPVTRVLAVAFRRWTVEHTLRIGKQEAGLMHYEGRDYTGLLRHRILTRVVRGFVVTPTQRLRGKNPLVTAEQVCRTLNQRCVVVFRRRRGIPEVRHTSNVICYHQKRNAQAAKSHKKQRHRSIL